MPMNREETSIMWAAALTVCLAVCFLVVKLARDRTASAAKPGPATNTSSGGQRAAGGSPADSFFGLTNVWTFHLLIEPEAWATIEPKSPPFIGRTDMNRPRPGSGEGSPPRFGPGAGPNEREPQPRPMGGPQPQREEFEYVRALLEFDGRRYADIGVRHKGNSSFRAAGASIKRSLKLDFNRFSKTQKFLGLTKLNLNNNAMDPSQMREAMAYAVFHRAGLPASRTAFVRLYLTVPGRYDRQYAGLYTAVEQVDDRFLRANFGTKQGLLLKPERTQGLPYLGEGWDAYTHRYIPKSQADTEEARRVIDLARLIEKGDDAEFAAQIAGLVDAAGFLRFVAVQSCLANMDSPLFTGHNYYLYLNPATRQFHFIPWDLNEAFGGFFPAGSPEQQMDLSIASPFGPGNRLFERLMRLPHFKEDYRRAYLELMQSGFSQSDLNANIDAVAQTIGSAVAEDKTVSREQFARNLELESSQQTAGVEPRPQAGAEDRPRESGGRRGIPGVIPRMPKPFLKPFIAGRIHSIRTQLDGKAPGYTPRMRGPGQRPGPGFGFDPGAPGGPIRVLVMALFRETDDNRDERLSETEFTTAFANRFEAWDWNKDGGLDPRELNGGLLQLMPPPPDQMRGPGGRLEAEGGQRDPVRMQPEWRPRGPEQGLRPLDGPLVPLATTLIRMADPDNDRRATPDEWRTASQRWFREWDKDRSGQLEPRELAESLEQALGQPGPDR